VLSGGLACIVGAALVVAAFPALWSYDVETAELSGSARRAA
jgi:hypothetical protein